MEAMKGQRTIRALAGLYQAVNQLTLRFMLDAKSQ